ncbi:MAG: ABC transporter ATP-binding protein [Clostridia bacterium]|nr:ABC transporter ATP-binding protein [Clostridia bacterium]
MSETQETNRLKGDKKIPFRILARRTLEYVRPEWLRFVLAGLLIVINVGLDVVLPLFVRDVTDNLTSDRLDLRRVIIAAVLYFVVYAVNQLFLYWEAMLLQKAGQNIVYTLRMNVFTHIEQMSQNQFTEMPVGALVTRVTNYTQSLSDMFTNVIVNVIRNVLSLFGVYGIMIYISPQLSLLLLIPVVLVFVSSLIFSRYIGKTFRAERKNLSELNTFLNENLSGMKITQIFNQEKRKLKEFDEKNDNLRKSKFRSILGFGLYRPFISLIYIASIALSFYVGVKNALDAAALVAFYLYLSKFFNPIQALADQVNNVQKALTASERLFNLMDVQPEVRDLPDAVDVDHFEGKIEFRHVWFAYVGEDWILKDVSFVIQPKQTCAFVGATGAGKTTILSLIVRNYEIQKGQILIDDMDIAHIRLQSLRRAAGQMLQDVFLFSGSIRTNITLHDTSFTDEQINDACRYVNADSFISKLPHGLDEEVVERGENLSQGQRQLLSFARTVLHKPQILILDEATANIDTETEVLIQESLEKIKNIGTMLVVAHRLSTIQHADQIIVLQKGEVIERGTHQELLHGHGYYYKLYQLQFENREKI